VSERTDVARALVELWNAGARGGQDFARYCAPDFELESPLSAVAGEPYRGVAGLQGWLRDVEEQFSEWHVELGEAREVGDAVLTITTVRARGRASGVALEFDSAAVIRFDDEGLVAWARIYADVAEALAALGLER
jgi:ketosteroid isomerase-like protein